MCCVKYFLGKTSALCWVKHAHLACHLPFGWWNRLAWHALCLLIGETCLLICLLIGETCSPGMPSAMWCVICVLGMPSALFWVKHARLACHLPGGWWSMLIWHGICLLVGETCLLGMPSARWCVTRLLGMTSARWCITCLLGMPSALWWVTCSLNMPNDFSQKCPSAELLYSATPDYT